MNAFTSLRSWILGGVVAVLVIFLLFASSLLLFALRADGPPPEDTRIPIRVDASLSAGGARVVTEAWPIVRFEVGADGSARVGAYDSASDGKSQHVEFTLHLGSGASIAPTRVRWYDPDGTIFFNALEWGESIEGTITIDADRPPAQGDDRVVAYDLRAMRDDQPVELRGKVRIPYAARPR